MHPFFWVGKAEKSLDMDGGYEELGSCEISDRIGVMCSISDINKYRSCTSLL